MDLSFEGEPSRGKFRGLVGAQPQCRIGREILDRVAFAGVSMPNKSIGVVPPSSGLNGLDGVMG